MCQEVVQYYKALQHDYLSKVYVVNFILSSCNLAVIFFTYTLCGRGNTFYNSVQKLVTSLNTNTNNH